MAFWIGAVSDVSCKTRTPKARTTAANDEHSIESWCVNCDFDLVKSSPWSFIQTMEYTHWFDFTFFSVLFHHYIFLRFYFNTFSTSNFFNYFYFIIIPSLIRWRQSSIPSLSPSPSPSPNQSHQLARRKSTKRTRERREVWKPLIPRTGDLVVVSFDFLYLPKTLFWHVTYRCST